MQYRGWEIGSFTEHGKPHFYAAQCGVTMNTNTLEGIKRMIDYKIQDDRDRREKKGVYREKPKISDSLRA